MDFASEERLTVVDHPLIKHKLSVIRNEDTPDYLFRQTVREITLLEGYAATQDLATRSVEVKTPIATCECESIRGIEPVVVPILRAGLGMLDGMLDLIPTAPVAHLGMYRDEITHEPHEYYAKMPDYIVERSVLLVDPMLATGGSLCAAIDALRKQPALSSHRPRACRPYLSMIPLCAYSPALSTKVLMRMPTSSPAWVTRAIAFSVPKARRFKANWLKSGRGSDDQARAPFMGRVLYDLGR